LFWLRAVEASYPSVLCERFAYSYCSMCGLLGQQLKNNYC